ncbi:MAG: alkyl hydroperoxide reductase/Thiol specific antioxidant/Mal allergen [Bacteroidetes bacterium]|nr:alkyl hydroperoxide reductase/Thiol specific antioxidant/Mal allergen [Bacteroidota bacterium]
MRNHVILFLFLFCTLQSSFAAAKTYPAHLSLNIEGTNAKEVYLSYTKNGAKVTRTLPLLQGAFVWEDSISEPVRAKLKVDSVVWPILLDIGSVSVSFSVKSTNFNEIVYKGSKTWDDWTSIELEKSRLKVTTDTLLAEIEVLEGKLKDEKNPRSYKLLSDNLERTKFEADSLFTQKCLSPLFFLQSDSTSFARLLNGTYSIPLGYSYTSDKVLNRWFGSFSQDLQNSPTGRLVKKMIDNYASVKVGNMAPDFTTEDINKKAITLSDFRNKNIVLLDAWASWCGPCLESIPHIKELNKKYKDKGLVVIGVSLDFKLDSWRKSIDENQISDWIHVLASEKPWISQEFTGNDIFMKYPIGIIPRYYLVGKDGRILGMWQFLSDGNFREMNELFSKVFDEN